MNFDEAGLIAILASIFGNKNPGVEVGIGDDGAVVVTTERTVITTDMAVEGTHFNTNWSSAFEIGRKVAGANLADVYAMGATPSYLVVALALTGQESIEWITELAQGIAFEASSCGAYVVGGDIARGNCKTISITAIGDVGLPITRSGAQVGDRIYVSSLPGWSRAGLEIIERDLGTDISEYAISQFCAPTLDYETAVGFLKSGAHAMCDISDALIIQGEQLAQVSKVALLIDQQLIALHPEFKTLKELADSLDIDVWQWILAGGEDHVFLATGKDLVGFCIGSVIQGEGLHGVEMKKAPEPWRHFH